MKKVLLIASFLLLGSVTVTITGCSSDAPIITPTIASRLIGKWTMKTAISNTTISGNTDSQNTDFTSNDYFEFKTGGAVTIVESGSTYNGTWKVTNDRVYFTGTNYMDNTAGWAVQVLTANTLQLYNKEVNNFSSTELILNLSK